MWAFVMTSDEEPTLLFHRVYPEAVPPMRADKSALGTMPMMAYRHCEPLRSASSFGWYVFPPEEVRLKWNGVDVLRETEGEWQPLMQADLPGFSDYWDEHAPPDLRGLSPPFLSRLPMPGLVQVWSGLFCSTRPGWSVLVRPLANVATSRYYRCFEGIVEADTFQPFPLFINIQLVATDVLIQLPKVAPLFQVQPLLRATYAEEAHVMSERVGLGQQDDGDPALSLEQWAGYRRCVRVENYDDPEVGQYATAVRKRSRHVRDEE